MSGYTMTQTELLYSCALAGTTTSNVTGAQNLMATTYPAMIIPAGYFAGLGTRTGSLKLRAGVLFTSTATVPTFKFGVSFTTSNTFAATTPNFETATNTPNAGTNTPVVMDIDIMVRSIGNPGTNSTIVVQGLVTSPDKFASPFAMSVPATNVANTYTSFDPALQYWVWLYGAIGAATAGNTMTLQYAKLYGEN